MTAYYNDIDGFVCDWLEALIAEGLISPGVVDRRSIEDVQPADLDGFKQCHFFAGIGGWSLALRMAGWPDDRPVWTGSCPCQPFSSAGKRKGTDDERHLWPAFHRLIAERRPPACFGEQVASADGRLWLAGVFADLEAVGYRTAGADLCAACVGAPHIRQRLYWVADGSGGGLPECRDASQLGSGRHADGDGAMCSGLADSQRDGRGSDQPGRGPQPRTAAGRAGEVGPGLADAEPVRAGAGERDEQGGPGLGRSGPANGGPDSRGLGDAGGARPSQLGGRRDEPARSATSVWDACRLVECREPTRQGGTRTVWRRAPVEPSLFPVADGLPGRVGLLRGAGNAIVPHVAAKFIAAWMDT